MSSYLQLKKRAFMSIVNGVKGFVRTVSGVPPISLEDCVDSDSLIDWKLYGNSVQEGTPTPEAPVEVVSVGEYDSETGKYKIPVTARGKNLVDIPYINANTNITTINCNLTKTITISMRADNIELVKPIWRLEFIYKDGSRAYFSDSSVSYSKTILISEENPVVKINYRGQYITAGSYNDIMIEYGTTATAYEPYHKPITTNLFLDEPLRKVGDYADYVDFGKGEVVRNVKELELTSAQYYNAYVYAPWNFYGFVMTMSEMQSGARQAGFCTHLQNVIGSNSSPIWFGVGNQRIYMSFPDIYNSAETDAERVTAFKAFLTEQEEAGTPVKVTYILAEPTRTPISIPKLPTIKGTTIYETGTSINASNMEATYYSSIKGE